MKLNTYLTFNGDCEAAFKFYEKALGAKPGLLKRYSEAPSSDQCPGAMSDKIMHARITIGGDVLMGSDAPPERFKGKEGFSLSLSVATAEEADRLFAALSEKGHVIMPCAETFWAIRFGMLTDQFGITWMFNCEKPF